jgi:hypothetical protein
MNYERFRSCRAVSTASWLGCVLVMCFSSSAFGQCPPPSTVSASDGDNCDGIALQWSAVAQAVAYVVWRSDENNVQTAQPLATVSATSYLDTAVDPAQSYYYWIQSDCSPFTGPFSSVVMGSSAASPTPPQNFSAFGNCEGVELSWATPPAGTEYRIYRATTLQFDNAQLIATVQDKASYFDADAPASTSVSSLWYWVQPVTLCGEGTPAPMVIWRCVPEPAGVGIPNVATSNWRARAAATLFNACRVGPQDFRDFFLSDMDGADQILLPQNFSALPPLYWNEELAAAANYHAIDISTMGCDAYEFNSCNGASFSQRILSFLSVSPGTLTHLPLSIVGNAPSWLPEALENPAYKIGFQILGGTVAVPDSQSTWLRDYIFDQFGPSNLKQFGFGYSIERAFNDVPFASVEKMGAAPSDPSKIVIASHTPDFANENVLYMAIYHDPLGVGPQSAQVEINGQWITLGLLSGTSSSGAFYWSEPMCSVADPCRQYRFRFVTAMGEELFYPEVGRLGTAGLPCDCDAEYYEEQPSVCPGDLNGDDVVNVSDLLILLGNWGSCPGENEPCPGDLNGDGVVNVSDLLILLGNWGVCPE